MTSAPQPRPPNVSEGDPEEENMKALVTAASKHGGTLEIAETIARVLDEHGLSAEVVEIDRVRNLGSYDVYVIGSGIIWATGPRRPAVSS